MSSMLNSLFRFFQPIPLPSTEDGSHSPPDSTELAMTDKGKGKEREIPMSLRGQARGGGDSIPLERKPSFFSMDRSLQGPSHIAWAIPTPVATPTRGSPAQSRRSFPPKSSTETSTSLPSAEGSSSTVSVSNAAAGSVTAQQSASDQTNADGLRLLSMYYLGELISESETSSTNASISLNKPLPSPADTNVQFPASDPRPPADPVPLTPDSARLRESSVVDWILEPALEADDQPDLDVYI
ncbi:hypothetical protein NM688_g6302 [Phlebia brevispora]|uniref:Uncharacterized protein n=1 Tax=Phlebia brevispora TaxID=194682 RepID=A0ACC1SHG7_9APHY|nr:hypothetical protein NM688_g6302 [Phlebia brevispora]